MYEAEKAWTHPGAESESILGDCHMPSTDARGVVLIVHGFLGYKDYGMFPAIARSFADAGFIAHRFNLSHSGMTNAIETFERPDLFERDTWRKQVADVRAVVEAIRAGQLAGAGLPLFLFGHSRGGDTCLLAAAEMFVHKEGGSPSGVITAAAPSSLCRMDASVEEQLLQDGFIEHKSNRTGQILRIGSAWLIEQRDDPRWHDLCARVRSIACPLLFIHGEDDPTVPAADASELAEAARSNGGASAANIHLVGSANHVFNTPNPMPRGEPLPEALDSLTSVAINFVNAHAEGS